MSRASPRLGRLVGSNGHRGHERDLAPLPGNRGRLLRPGLTGGGADEDDEFGEQAAPRIIAERPGGERGTTGEWQEKFNRAASLGDGAIRTKRGMRDPSRPSSRTTRAI